VTYFIPRECYFTRSSAFISSYSQRISVFVDRANAGHCLVGRDESLCDSVYAPKSTSSIPLVLEGVSGVGSVAGDKLFVQFALVLDNGQALEVSNALSIPVGDACDGLLVDLLDALEIAGDVGLGGALSLDDEVP